MLVTWFLLIIEKKNYSLLYKVITKCFSNSTFAFWIDFSFCHKIIHLMSFNHKLNICLSLKYNVCVNSRPFPSRWEVREEKRRRCKNWCEKWRLRVAPSRTNRHWENEWKNIAPSIMGTFSYVGFEYFVWSSLLRWICMIAVVDAIRNVKSPLK